MEFHGMQADSEFTRDLLVRQSLRHPFQYLPLTPGQRFPLTAGFRQSSALSPQEAAT